MYGSINGNKAIVSPVYSPDELALDLEYTPVTTPTFTTQPQSTEAPEGGSGFVNWILNFEPSKLEILRYNGDRPSYNYETLSVRTRSAQVEPSTDAYCIRAYYNDKDYVDSAKFHVYKMNPEAPFYDVPADSFYNDPVIWAVENGITNGVSELLFGSSDNCLRAHVVTFLWKAEKSPEPSAYTKSFKDVPSGAWYYKPVHWAVEHGITSGTSDTTFGAADVCSRYQVVYFLWAAAGKPEPKTTHNPFTDVKTSHFFYKAVLWAVENGITSGTSATTFSPTSPCNRAQVVTFLYKAYN
jgi:hypothetical protein